MRSIFCRRTRLHRGKQNGAIHPLVSILPLQQFLRASGRRYILGTAKQSLRQFEQELLAEDWQQMQEGLEVRIIPAPEGEEVFILCHSGATGERTGHARPLRSAHRARFAEDRRQL